MSRRDFQIVSEYIYARPPPKIYFLHPFVCPKFYQKAFCAIKKKNRKHRKNKKNKNTQKTKKQEKQTLNEMLSQSFPRVFFLRFTVALDIFLKKRFPLPAFGIHYFPKKTAFPKIFPAIYFKLLSLKTGRFQREVASREESSI